MKKSKLLLAVLLVSFLVLAYSVGFGEVNLRTANLATLVDEILSPRLLPDYKLIISKKVVMKGKGRLGGDATVYKIYFPKDLATYKKMKKDGSLLKSDLTRIIVSVDIYKSPADALKHVKKKGLLEGTFSGEPIGDKAWHKEIPKKTVESVRKEEEAKKKEKKEEKEKKINRPLTPQEKKKLEEQEKKKKEEQEKKDKELAEKLAKDPKNYNMKKLIVVKRFAQIEIRATNYQKMPDSALLEEIARKIAEKL